MNIKLENIANDLPMLRDLFDDNVFLTVIDTDCKIQGFSLPEGSDPIYSIGDTFVDPTGAFDEVMRTKKPSETIFPKK